VASVDYYYYYYGYYCWRAAKMAEPIEMPFGLWTWVASRKHAFRHGPDPSCGEAILRRKRGGQL